MEKLKKFLYSAAAVGLAWWINGWFTSYGIFNWYAQFEKPTITPPDLAFPIIWSILYVLMIAAFYMILLKQTGVRDDGSISFLSANWCCRLSGPICFLPWVISDWLSG